MAELTTGLSGAAGEYYAAAELSRRGFIATVTIRNAERIDIMASRPEGGRTLQIQVKTIQGDAPKWVLRDKCENHHSPDFFYILVRLGKLGTRPNFHIVPSKVIAEVVKSSHAIWLGGTKKDGSARKDSSIRNFLDFEGKFKEAWSLLG